MKPATARHRVDATSKALEAEAKRRGVGVINLGGAVDAAWWIGSSIRLIDYKSPAAGLTDTQARIVAAGCPVRFISTVDQVTALTHEMRVEAGLSVVK